MYIVKFERNAKNGLKPKIILENDNSHLQLKLNQLLASNPNQEEEKKLTPSATNQSTTGYIGTIQK